MTLARAYQSQLLVDLVSIFDDEEYDGVISDLSDQWCVVASIEDFNSDGYWIIRRDTLKNVRHRKYEAFRHQILSNCGILANVRSLEALDISTTSKLFNSLVRLQQYVIIYRETDTDWWSHHAALAGIDRNQLLMHSFDGAGRFNKNFTKYKWAEITSIRIGCPYLQTYQNAAPYNFVTRQPVSQKP